MTRMTLKFAAVALAAPVLAVATPSAAAPFNTQVSADAAAWLPQTSVHTYDTAANGRDRYRRYDDYRHGRGYDRRDDRRYDRRGDRRYDSGYDRGYYEEPVYRDTRVWQGNDGRYYCRRKDGTTGLLIGAGVGALLGNEIAGRGDRTLGAILGAAGGALLGREIDRGSSRCR